MDVAKAYQLLQEKSKTQTEIASLVGKSQGQVAHSLALLKETQTVQDMIGKHVGGAKVVSSASAVSNPITETRVREVQASGIETPEEREEILVKASDEELTYRETRAVADAYVAAETPELREEILELWGLEPGSGCQCDRLSHKRLVSRRLAQLLRLQHPTSKWFRMDSSTLAEV
jgi:hypothetical protein